MPRRAISPGVSLHALSHHDAPAIRHIFHQALIDCMARARSPCPAEIEAVAKFIWRDVNGAEATIPWHDLSAASPDRRRAMAAARAALGLDISDAAQPQSTWR